MYDEFENRQSDIGMMCGKEDQLIIELVSYFWWAWPVLTDTILVGTAFLFVARLHLIERKFQEELVGFGNASFKNRIKTNFSPSPEEEWFLASGFE
jgi:hypothetical protein